jgi:pyruvate/2-oxoglutarate/acetoin dehydrogenase E1 component
VVSDPHHNSWGGSAPNRAAQIAAKAFEWLDAPIRRYALPDLPAMPYAQELEDMVYPTVEGIVEHAVALTAY